MIISVWHWCIQSQDFGNIYAGWPRKGNLHCTCWNTGSSQTPPNNLLIRQSWVYCFHHWQNLGLCALVPNQILEAEHWVKLRRTALLPFQAKGIQGAHALKIVCTYLGGFGKEFYSNGEGVGRWWKRSGCMQCLHSFNLVLGNLLSKVKLKNLLIKVKEESEKAGLKLDIQKTKIMAYGPITSWQIDGETVETVTYFIFSCLKSLQMVTAAMELKDTCFLQEKLWPT